MYNLKEDYEPKTLRINKFRNLFKKFIPIPKTIPENKEVLIRKEEIVDNILKTLLVDPEEVSRRLMAVVKTIISQDYPDFHFQDSELEEFLINRVKKLFSSEPEKKKLCEIQMKSIFSANTGTRRMILNGDSFKFKFFYEVLVNTAEWLIKNGKLKHLDCPIGLGSRRYLINTEPKHKNGVYFRSYKLLSNGLCIEVRLPKKTSVKSAKMLLEKFGYSQDILKIE